ncbi:hypothetical protein L596_026627 [Steinernema carpocapsae]|uniref:Uncharacterized protein n=1 Tax=Steinernema carpocapsae TaxID=34508 RepID=A0A4U5M1Y5_STECR|nr:hypothetical protein L596_026627 [Steinernema carpocapsae]
MLKRVHACLAKSKADIEVLLERKKPDRLSISPEPSPISSVANLFKAFPLGLIKEAWKHRTFRDAVRGNSHVRSPRDFDRGLYGILGIRGGHAHVVLNTDVSGQICAAENRCEWAIEEVKTLRVQIVHLEKGNEELKSELEAAKRELSPLYVCFSSGGEFADPGSFRRRCCQPLCESRTRVSAVADTHLWPSLWPDSSVQLASLWGSVASCPRSRRLSLLLSLPPAHTRLDRAQHVFSTTAESSFPPCRIARVGRLHEGPPSASSPRCVRYQLHAAIPFNAPTVIPSSPATVFSQASTTERLSERC